MSGFLKRDLSLQAVNAKFYLCFVLAFAGLAVFTDFAASFASLYLVIFAGTSIMSLFSYDEANHWEAYAASAPNGRRATVDARYLLAALIGGVVFLFQLVLGLFERSNDPVYAPAYDPLTFLHTALLYAGAFLLYAAVILPISYRFGGTKSRIVMIVVVAAFSALIAVGATSLQVFSDGDPLAVLGRLPALLPLLGAAALFISHRISRHILATQEL